MKRLICKILGHKSELQYSEMIYGPMACGIVCTRCDEQLL